MTEPLLGVEQEIPAWSLQAAGTGAWSGPGAGRGIAGVSTREEAGASPLTLALTLRTSENAPLGERHHWRRIGHDDLVPESGDRRESLNRGDSASDPPRGVQGPPRLRFFSPVGRGGPLAPGRLEGQVSRCHLCSERCRRSKLLAGRGRLRPASREQSRLRRLVGTRVPLREPFLQRQSGHTAPRGQDTGARPGRSATCRHGPRRCSEATRPPSTRLPCGLRGAVRSAP